MPANNDLPNSRWLKIPLRTIPKRLQWRAFDAELRAGKLKHLEFDPDKQTLIWHRPKADKDKLLQQGFYAKLQAREIAVFTARPPLMRQPKRSRKTPATFPEAAF